MRSKLPRFGLVIQTMLLIGLSATEARAFLAVETGLSIQEFLTDNLFFTENNKEEDLGTSISPRLGLRYETKNILLGATYIGTAEFFVNNTSSNSYGQDANFEIDFPGLTRRYKGLEVKLIESFTFTPELRGFSFTREPGEEQIVNQAITYR